MFLYVAPRKKGDDFGEYIRPEEYLRAEEREEVDMQQRRSDSQMKLGQKRRWDETGPIGSGAGSTKRHHGLGDEQKRDSLADDITLRRTARTLMLPRPRKTKATSRHSKGRRRLSTRKPRLRSMLVWPLWTSLACMISGAWRCLFPNPTTQVDPGWRNEGRNNRTGHGMPKTPSCQGRGRRLGRRRFCHLHPSERRARRRQR